MGLSSRLGFTKLICRSKGSEQLISSDTHSNTSNYKFTYSVEIVPVCKDDLVCIPRPLAKAWGNITYVLGNRCLCVANMIRPLTICSRVGNTIHLLDPNTLQQTDVTAPVYWRQPFESLATVSDLVEFVVLDVEYSNIARGKYVLADVQVMRAAGTASSRPVGEDEEMGHDGIFYTRTHLGGILQPGDAVLGYHLTNANFNNDAYEAFERSGENMPDVILVKKTYPNRRKKNKPRNWKLRSIAKEAEDVGESTVGRGALGRRGGVDQKNVERDYELFLRDLEEDKEMRAAINLYKRGADEGTGPKEEEDGDVAMGAGAGVSSKAGSGLKGGKRRGKTAKPAPPVAVMEVEEDLKGTDGDGESVDGDDDFPEIEMDELLEHFEEMDMGDELDGGQEVQ